MVSKLRNQTLLWLQRRNTRKKDKMEMPKERRLLGKSRGPRIVSDAVILWEWQRSASLPTSGCKWIIGRSVRGEWAIQWWGSQRGVFLQNLFS